MSTSDSDESTSVSPLAWHTHDSSLSGAGDHRFVYVPDSEICRRMFESWSYMIKKRSYFGLTDTEIVYFNEYFGFRGPPNDLKEYWPTVYTMDQLHNMAETKPYDSFPNEQKIDMLNSYRAHAQEKRFRWPTTSIKKGEQAFARLLMYTD